MAAKLLPTKHFKSFSVTNNSVKMQTTAARNVGNSSSAHVARSWHSMQLSITETGFKAEPSCLFSGTNVDPNHVLVSFFDPTMETLMKMNAPTLLAFVADYCNKFSAEQNIYNKQMR